MSAAAIYIYKTFAIKKALLSELFFIFNESGKIYSSLESMFFPICDFACLIFLDAYVFQTEVYFVYKPNIMPTDLIYCELFDKNDKNLNSSSI